MEILEQTFADWLRAKQLSDTTVEHYTYYFRDYFSLYGQFSQRSVSDFLSRVKYSNRIGRAFLSNLQTFIKVHYKQLGLTESQIIEVTSVELPKITGRKKERELNIIPIEYIRLIEDALPNERERLKLILTFYCGLRLEEMINIRIIDFNWDFWKLDVNQTGELRVIGKGDKQRTIPVPNFVMVRVARYVKSKSFSSSDSCIFITSKHPVRLNSRKRSWQKELNKAGIKSGFTKKDNLGRIISETKVHPHKLRHSYASYLLENGMNIKQIQELLGHSDISTTQMYLHINKSKLKEQVGEIFKKD